MSVSSPVRDLKLNDKTDMVSPTESTGRLDIPGIVALRKDVGKDDSKDELRKELEMYNIKELMLIHLDYIQQQTEVAQIKDKLIADLENQVETLKQRLHRMTRRVSLNKGRSHSATNPNGVVGHKMAANGLPATSEAKAALGATTPLLRRKRQQSGLDGNYTSVDEPPTKKLNKFLKKNHLGCRSRRRTPSESSKPELPDRSILNKLKTIWTTKETYTTIVGETESAMRWAGSSAADSDSIAKQVVCSSKASLEVPKWRVHSYSPMYSMEGTENLCDNVYDVKHEKLAADERRRKRWDHQRIREHWKNEELRKKQERPKKAQESSGSVEANSFWPEPPELGERLTLCVSDEVPIGFCGINLLPPSKEEQEFTLPWKNGCETYLMKPRRRGKR